MENQLVSFGNFLFNRYGVQVYSTDGKNTPLYERQVHDADIQNWKQSDGLDLTDALPSRFQIKDLVEMNFFGAGRVINCRILSVHFFEGKVKYDLEIMVGKDDNGPQVTRVYNVDSVYVTEPE